MEAAEQRRYTIPERLWIFFASVKTAIVLIALIAIFSILGTLIPQENTIPSDRPAAFYPSEYGTFGTIMYGLGLTHMYTSTWFIALLIAIGLNLIICSWERLVPLHLSLKRQPVTVKPFLLKTRGLYQAIESDGPNVELTDRFILEMQKRRYKVRREGNAFLAEKGRVSRYGPYVLHIGLLIIIAGCMMRLIPGFYYSGNILIDEGQTVQVPGAGFSVRNDRATEEQYDDGRPKYYETQATVIDNGKEVMHSPITVNHPLKYHGIILFQAAMLPLQYKSMDIALTDNKNNNQQLGQFHLDFSDPKPQYQLGAYTVKLLNYFPDFQGLDSNKQPTSKSSIPYAPAFILSIKGPGIDGEQKQWFVPSAPFLQAALAKQFQYNLVPIKADFSQTTGLRVQKDYGIPIVYAGCAVVVLGLAMTFYIQHRRIWGNLSEGVLHLGGQTHKNWYSFQKETERILMAVHIEPQLIRAKGGKE